MTLDNAQNVIQQKLRQLLFYAEQYGKAKSSPHCSAEELRLITQDYRKAETDFIEWDSQFLERKP